MERGIGLRRRSSCETPWRARGSPRKPSADARTGWAGDGDGVGVSTRRSAAARRHALLDRTAVEVLTDVHPPRDGSPRDDEARVDRVAAQVLTDDMSIVPSASLKAKATVPDARPCAPLRLQVTVVPTLTMTFVGR